MTKGLLKQLLNLISLDCETKSNFQLQNISLVLKVITTISRITRNFKKK